VRTAKAIAIYGVVIVLISAFCAPWIYWILQKTRYSAYPFHRVFDRVILVFAIIGLWPLLRAVGLPSPRDAGFLPVSWWWKDLLAGWIVGAVSFAIAAALLKVTGVRTWDEQAHSLLSAAVKFLVAGFIVGVIEEFFFRGGLQTVFCRAFNPTVAILLVSVIFAFAHFFKPQGAPKPPEVLTWASGFEHLGRVVTGSASAPGFLFRMITLTLTGVNLGVAFARTGALYFSIGLHAGWVVVMKTFSAATRGADMVASAWTWPVLLAVLVLVIWLTRFRLESVRSRDG
jgi:membrane protease YdiL (CAAX protease family)